MIRLFAQKWYEAFSYYIFPYSGFKYDNILMEEAAQILEIETFIPLLLQNPEDGYNRLKRWIMIGDHHQLPPVIQNMAFQKYSNIFSQGQGRRKEVDWG